MNRALTQVEHLAAGAERVVVACAALTAPIDGERARAKAARDGAARARCTPAPVGLRFVQQGLVGVVGRTIRDRAVFQDSPRDAELRRIGSPGSGCAGLCGIVADVARRAEPCIFLPSRLGELAIAGFAGPSGGRRLGRSQRTLATRATRHWVANQR